MESYTISDNEFDLFRNLIYRESGINLADNKKQLVIGRLGKRLRKLGLSSFREYYEYLHNEGWPQELTVLLDSISTNKTDFFRDQAQFDFFKKDLCPCLFNEGTHKRIRIWSAACSTGEEPYSIAVTLFETAADLNGCNVRILASDISTKALDEAERGVYDKERMKPISSDVMSRHFLKGVGENTGKFMVKRHLSDMITFRKINLMDEEYPVSTLFDVIFFRNTMIYFDKPTQKLVICRLLRYLKDGGYMFLGNAESLHGIDCDLTFLRPNLYRKTGRPTGDSIRRPDHPPSPLISQAA